MGRSVQLPNQKRVKVANVLYKEFEMFCSTIGNSFRLGTELLAVFIKMCETLGIHKTRIMVLHLHPHGGTDKQDSRDVPCKVVSNHHQDWDQLFPFFLLIYRSPINKTTRQSPANLIFV